MDFKIIILNYDLYTLQRQYGGLEIRQKENEILSEKKEMPSVFACSTKRTRSIYMADCIKIKGRFHESLVIAEFSSLYAKFSGMDKYYMP